MLITLAVIAHRQGRRYGVTHKPEVEERRWDIGCPVTIGDDVWVGGGAIILGPCTIGSGKVII